MMDNWPKHVVKIKIIYIAVFLLEPETGLFNIHNGMSSKKN